MKVFSAALMTAAEYESSHVQDRQAEVAEEVISATLCTAELVARLAVSEASLQRLHGSPAEAQPKAAQLGSWAIPRPAQAGLPTAIESGQKSPASASPGKLRHAVLCHCARPSDWGQCQIEQILGLSCPAAFTLAGWTDFFELLNAMLARITGPPTSEGESCAQRCASMADFLRGTLKGLPVSTLGAATTCLIAKISTVLANRVVYQDVSLQPPCPLQCLLSLASIQAGHRELYVDINTCEGTFASHCADAGVLECSYSCPVEIHIFLTRVRAFTGARGNSEAAQRLCSTEKTRATGSIPTDR